MIKIKEKLLLLLICICMLVCPHIALADDYGELGAETERLVALLESGGDAAQIIGEATILIAENEVVGLLAEREACQETASLKETVDVALTHLDYSSANELLTWLRQSVRILRGEAEPAVFADVGKDAWYYDAVMYTVSSGIFKGMSETQFAPDAEITRGMFLTLMGRMYKNESMTFGKGYADVSDDAYYADAVNWAKAQEILSFIKGEYFYPDSPITREELVTVLRGSMQEGGMDVSYIFPMRNFADASVISDWAKDNVSWAMAQKIVAGFEDGTFRPQATATRAQVAQILYNQRQHTEK